VFGCLLKLVSAEHNRAQPGHNRAYLGLACTLVHNDSLSAPGSITSWESLLSKFYNKFFPMSKVNEYRKEISSFTKEEDEKFLESWECFKDLLIKFPPHGYEKWRLVQFFYQGLSQPNRSMLNQ
jgi:hypothetical protein